MTASTSDPLARALLPAVMHGLNNATQLLSALNALAGRDDDDGWLEKRSADLARTSREIEDLGYALGSELPINKRDQRTGIWLAKQIVEIPTWDNEDVARSCGEKLASLMAICHPIVQMMVVDGFPTLAKQKR